MKKILIVENDTDHWTFFQSVLTSGFEVHPSTMKEFKLLRQSVSRRYGKGNLGTVIADSTRVIKTIIADFNPDLIVLDYQLKDLDDMCHGLRFIEDFLENQVIIIITGAVDGRKKNSILKFMESPSGNNKVSLLYKIIPLDEEFRTLLLEKVNKLLPGTEKDPKPRLKP